MRYLNLLIITALTTAVVGNSTLAVAQEGEPITVDVGKRYQINSAILGEQRDLLIHLPEGYQQSDGKYPVIYVLDGDTSSGRLNH